MNKQKSKQPVDYLVYRYVLRLNSEENSKYLALYDKAGQRSHSRFIASCIFGKELKVVQIDKAAMDYYMRLTNFHSQFRGVANNYNQVVRALNSTFSEKKALAFLYRLENQTKELIGIGKQIQELTDEFEKKWLLK